MVAVVVLVSIVVMVMLLVRRRRKVAQRPQASPIVTLVQPDAAVPRVRPGRFPGHRGLM